MILNQTVLIQNRVRLSNLLILGAVYYCRFSLLCCLPHYLLFLFGSIADTNENSKSSFVDFSFETDNMDLGINQSWLQAVIFYGFLVSIMQLGIVIESSLEGIVKLDISATSSSKASKIGVGMTGSGINQRSHSYCTQLCLYQFLMCCSYFGACFVTRLSVLLLCVFALGFSSGRCLSLSFSSAAPTSQTAFQSPSHQTLQFGRSREILLAIFTFVSLVSGFLYSNPDATLPTSPLRYNAFFVCIITCVSVSYHCCLPRILHSASRMSLNDRRKIQFDRRSSTGSADEESQQPEDDDEARAGYTVPANFLSTCRGDEKKARSMYAKMLRWRHEHSLDTILTRQQSSPHIFHR